MEYSLGIDLGTTYSAAATARGDRLEIFQLGERAATIPSVVVLRADGEVLTGEAAERRALSEPMRTAREFKRRLGDPTPIILGGTPYGAESLTGHLLRSLVAKVTEQMGGPPGAIALCHPASYGAYKTDLLRQAVRQADVGTVEFLTEPEAAAVHYALQERVPTGQVIAVYDFGGGTFDATILRKTEDGFEQLGRPEGMERLGGIDFDEAIFAHVMTTVRSSGVSVDPNDPATMAAVARLRDECRRAKEGLSVDTDATIPVYLPGIQTEVRLTREEFETMIRPRIRETIQALERAVKSAGLGFEDVDRVLLVGGSSRIPLVSEMIREATQRPVALDAHPKHTMALGAAHIAEQSRKAAGAEAAPAAVATAAAPSAAATSAPATVDEPSPAATTPPIAARVPAAAGPRRGRTVPVAIVGALVLVIAVAAAAFALLPRQPGGNGESPGTSLTASSPSASPALSPSISPSTLPSPSSSPTVAPITPSPSPAWGPGRQSRITGISIEGDHYSVAYEVHGYTHTAEPGPHVHFFWDTVPPSQAGVPGAAGGWIKYYGPIPFESFKVADRPAAATEICILVANADHSVRQNTGNCMALPD
jgi:molecular chaperone DnaK